MATVKLNIIRPALRLAGIMGAPQRVASASQNDEAFDVLSSYIDALITERLLSYYEIRSEQTLVAGQQDYTVGPGGDFNIDRPMTLDRASILLNAGTNNVSELPLGILTYELWQYITVKNIGSNPPTKVYYEPRFPLGVLHFWPYPSVGTQMVLYVRNQVAQFANLNSTVSFPPGYLKFLQYGLALELANYYGKKSAMSPEARETAKEARAWVKRLNILPLDIRVDPALVATQQPFNIYSGDYPNRG
jgi:hypothetical protein